MDSRNIRGLCEAYSAVYNDDLKELLKVTSFDEDLSFIDDLSDNELDQVMEDLFVSGEIDINECFDSLNYVLTEARVTSSDDRPSGSARVTTSAERPSRVAKTAERQRQVRVGRIAQSAQRTGEKLAGAARSSGTSVSGRVKQASEKVKSAKEKVKGFLGKLGRAAKAGASAAKKELSGEAERESKAKRTGLKMRTAARRQVAKADAEKAFSTGKTRKALSGSSVKGALPPAKQKALSGSSVKGALPPAKQKALSGSSVKGALPPAKDSDRRAAAKAKLQKASAGSTAKGIRFAGERVGQLATQRAHTGKQSALEKFRKKAGIGEDIFNDILNVIFEEMIREGYVDSYENALYVLESLSESDVQDVVESYLVEETEVVDLYDVVLEHLLDEGYANTEDQAIAIMANMSEQWRDEILGEANSGYDDPEYDRQWAHQVSRGRKKLKAISHDTLDKDKSKNPTGKYAAMQRRKRQGLSYDN